jgi:hypothetical protein
LNAVKAMALVQDPTTKWLVTFSIAILAMAIGNRVLDLYWPHWLAAGVSFFVCWAVALYVLKPQLRRFNTTWQVVGLAALGGGTRALLAYVF